MLVSRHRLHPLTDAGKVSLHGKGRCVLELNKVRGLGESLEVIGVGV